MIVPELREAMQNQVDVLSKPGAQILVTLTPARVHLMHMSWALCGELLELQLAYDNDDYVNIVEELSDCEFYMEGLRESFGYPHRAGDVYTQKQMNEINTSESLVELVELLLDATKKFIIYNDGSFLEKVKAVYRRIRKVLNVLYMHSGELLTQLASNYNSVFELVMNTNFDKLRVRYEGAYSDKAAKDRLDKK